MVQEPAEVSNIVIAYPGQDVELLCTIPSADNEPQSTKWRINDQLNITIEVLRNGRLPGYNATMDGTLIIQNITMNDIRNGSDYNCIKLDNEGGLVDMRSSIILCVAGKYQ